MDKFYFVFATYEEARAACPQFESDAAIKLRQEAEESRRREEESFQRCDTDGFLSQWAHNITAQEKEREAHLANQGGMIVQPALMDIETGEIVAGCIHLMKSNFHYGTDFLWKVYKEKNGKPYQWVGDAKRESTFEKKGLRKVWVLAPAIMLARSPGNHLPEQRGLGGAVSYTGKHAEIDHKASGLPL